MGPSQPRAGVVVDGKYRLVEPLGEGGIGAVWRGWQELVERPVAVKVLKQAVDKDFRARFLMEARALGRLSHQNCITIYDFGYSDELSAYYLVMELLEGEPLDAWLGRRIPLSDVVEVGRQIANGLAYAHHQGVLHRDLKPENVFLVEAFNGETVVKLLDFGLARLVELQDERLTQTGETFGTPVYMSPEQIRGDLEAGPASDLYSLGVLLYELIDNRLPFWGETPMDILAGHLNDPVEPLRRPAVPSALSSIVYRLLEKGPEDRFANALAVWEALGDIDLEPESASRTFVDVESPDVTWSHLPRDFATSTMTGLGDAFSSQATLERETDAGPTLDSATLEDETLRDETVADEPATETLESRPQEQTPEDRSRSRNVSPRGEGVPDGGLRDATVDVALSETLADEHADLPTIENQRSPRSSTARPSPTDHRERNKPGERSRDRGGDERRPHGRAFPAAIAVLVGLLLAAGALFIWSSTREPDSTRTETSPQETSTESTSVVEQPAASLDEQPDEDDVPPREETGSQDRQPLKSNEKPRRPRRPTSPPGKPGKPRKTNPDKTDFNPKPVGLD